jgi:hypothetical protein
MSRYNNLTAAIRKVDDQHMIFYEVSTVQWRPPTLGVLCPSCVLAPDCAMRCVRPAVGCVAARHVGYVPARPRHRHRVLGAP